MVSVVNVVVPPGPPLQDQGTRSLGCWEGRPVRDLSSVLVWEFRTVEENLLAQCHSPFLRETTSSDLWLWMGCSLASRQGNCEEPDQLHSSWQHRSQPLLQPYYRSVSPLAQSCLPHSSPVLFQRVLPNGSPSYKDEPWDRFPGELNL